MASYLLIESRYPFEFRNTSFCPDLARRLSDTDNRVTILLVQNGVLPTRTGAYSPVLSELALAGVEILADDFSLRERGISLRANAARHQTVRPRSRHRPAGREREGDLALGGQDG